MIKLKIIVDFPENPDDLIPGEYIPGDCKVYQFDPQWFPIEYFLDLICKDFMEEYYERKEKSKKEKGQEDLPKGCRFRKKNKY